MEVDPVESLARAHHRVVLTAELMALGLGDHGISRERRSGRLVRLIRGAYAVAPLTEPIEILMARAATRRYRRAAVSCEFALALHGCDLTVPWVVHLLTPLPTPDGTPGVAIHSTRLPVPVVLIRGVPVVPAAFALAGAWTDLSSRRDRQAIVCAALVPDITSTTAVAATMPAARRVPGAGDLLLMCKLVDIGCESPLEMDYYCDIELAHGLPAPTGRQQWIELPDGRRRRVDVLYRASRLIVEIDGAHHWLDEATRRRDEAMDAVLAALGWRVRRFTDRDIRERPAWVAAEVRAELLAAA